MSSVNQPDVSINEMPLSLIQRNQLDKRSVPASEHTPWLMPPSLAAITQEHVGVWSTMLSGWPSPLVKLRCQQLVASAMPTALPCPPSQWSLHPG